ncbi:MAG: acyl carrier protein [Ruminococcus sp.]|nr:acyl carrier protein [Ruminococcus sp.]
MVFEKVRDLVAEQFDIEADEVTAESQIVDDLGADSLDVVDLISAVEDEFDVQIPDEKVEGIKTVGDIVAFIESFASED